MAVKNCRAQDCPQVSDNFGGIEWSGSGWSSKEVLNEINAITEAKPPPKYSTTRGQLRNQNDHKYVEGDFHYHNNIENNHNADNDELSHESSVHFDDFYYDYNFINFHEDLSNELGNLEEESEDSSPQGARPTHSMKENAWTDIPQFLTTTSPATTVTELHLLKKEEPQSTKTDDAKAESEKVNQADINDFLYEDYLVPVSATRLPPPSTTLHSQTVNKGRNIWSENPSTMQSLVFTTKQPVEDETWGQSGEGVENNYSDFSEEENHFPIVTPANSVPAARHQTSCVATKSNAGEAVEFNISSDKNVKSSKPLGSPLREKASHAATEFDSNVPEIPQTTSQYTDTPDAFTVKDWDLNQNPFAKSNSKWEDQLSTSSPLPFEKLFPLPTPLLPISGNQETSNDSISSAETEVRSDESVQGATYNPDVERIPPYTDTTGTGPTFQPPSFNLFDFDYNELFFPSVMQSSDNILPDPSVIASAIPQLTPAPAQDIKSTTPNAPALTTHAPNLSPHPVQTSPSRDRGAAFWITGNWSTVSI